MYGGLLTLVQKVGGLVTFKYGYTISFNYKSQKIFWREYATIELPTTTALKFTIYKMVAEFRQLKGFS